MNANGSSSIAMQAGAYASGKAEILKKEGYSDLKNQGKNPIANSNGFYDEVSVGVESVYDAEKNIKQKECQIRVYHKDDALPRSTIKLIRYSVESTSSSVPQGSIIPWYGSPGNIPNGFALCDGKNGTPDLRNRFIVGAGDTYKLSDIGGEDAVKLEPSQTSSHYHTFGYHNANNNGYFITTASKKINASLPSGTIPRATLTITRLTKEENQASGVPVGTVITWASANNPNENGTWLECNGQSCTAYPDLVKVLGSDTVPDYRGVFLRGLGSVTSTHYGTVQHQSNGLGELQGDAIRNIYGSFLVDDAVGLGGYDMNCPPNGAFKTGKHVNYDARSNAGPAGYWLSFNASYVVPTVNEDRPINRAVRYFIKAA